MKLSRLLAFILLLVSAPVAAQTVQQAPPAAEAVASIDSPSHVLHVDVTLNPEGRVGYRVTRLGKPVIDESRLGFLFTDAPEMLRNFAFAGKAERSSDSSWEEPWGEYRTIRNHYNELTVNFDETSALKRRMTIQFRVYDDGIGFRYDIPSQPNLTQANIADELTEFTIAEPGTAWWDEALEWNREEYLYRKTPIEEVGIAQTPLTIRTASGLHLSIHEAALVDYSGMDLRRVHGRVFKANLMPSSIGPKVTRDAPFTTPWRVIMIAPDAPALYKSAQIILNLNEPNKLGDVSWVKPMKYVGIWWAMHLDQATWNSGPKHGATTANAKRYIDFAAANGFKGVLVEGWNKGWDGTWFGNGWDFSFTQWYPDFDLPAVAAYAHSKGVELIGHHETGGNIANYEKQMDAGVRPLPAARHPQCEDRLCRGCGRHPGARRRRQDPLRMAPGPGHGPPPPEGRHRSGQAPHHHRRARAREGHGPSPHLSQLGVARGRARAWNIMPGVNPRTRRSTRRTWCSPAC